MFSRHIPMFWILHEFFIIIPDLYGKLTIARVSFGMLLETFFPFKIFNQAIK
jgi:hypothetical protein